MASSPPSAVVQPPARSALTFTLLAAAIVLALTVGWWAFVRTTWQPIMADVEPQDAADVIKELDKQKIAYRLADDGRTILVDSTVADKARIDLVASELPMRGQVGFELFNKSDMGLTEFDQKINYQRALQGEIARTILMLDGIKSVRVHLGLPDQSVFRDNRTPPTASVTLMLKPSNALTASRVRGIQRLIAGAVPDMVPDSVSVLDGTGRIVSEDSVAAPAASTEDDRLLADFRDRADRAIHSTWPSLRYAVTVSYNAAGLPPGQKQPDAIDAGQEPESAGAVQTSATNSFDIRVTTATALDASWTSALTRLITGQGFDRSRGDRLTFLVGPVPETGSLPSVPFATDRVVARSAPDPAPAGRPFWLVWWPAFVIGAFLLALAFVSDRLRARQRRSSNLASFTEQLRARLAVDEAVF